MKLRAITQDQQDAHARAALAKQLFNGCRIYLQAVKTIEAAAKRIEQVPE